MAPYPLPIQTEDKRRRNVLLYYFRYGMLDDKSLKVAYGAVDDERKLREWMRLQRVTMTEYEDSMINQSDGWFVNFVQGAVDFHNSLAHIHNLALEYRKLSITPTTEDPVEAIARSAKSGAFFTEYQRTQAALVEVIQIRINNVRSGAEKARQFYPEPFEDTYENRQQAARMVEQEIERLEGLKQQVKAKPASDVDVQTLDELSKPLIYYKDMSKKETGRFWKAQFDCDKALTWFSFAKDVIAIPATMDDKVMAKFMFYRFATACHDTWTLTISRRMAQHELESEGDPRLRDGDWFATNEDLVLQNFRNFHEMYRGCFPNIGGIGRILVYPHVPVQSSVAGASTEAKT